MTDFVVAEAAIRQLHARYIDAIWRNDIAACGDCLTEDCEWHISGEVIRGRAEAMAFMIRMQAGFRRMLITLRTPILEVGDGTAKGRTYFSAQNVLADGTPYAPIGIYFERFVDQGDRWRVAWRLFQTHYTGPPDLTGTFFDNPDYGAPPGFPEG